MFKKLMCWGQIVILVGIIVGCGTIPINQEIPTHPQEEQVMFGSFKLKLEKVDWGTESLCLTVSATNTGKQPLMMMKNLGFSLVNENGVRYVATSISGDAMLGSGGLNIAPAYNPYTPRKDTLCFDVPKDKYTVLVKIGTHVGNLNYDYRDFFKWALNL
ncbi:MAG: hypothetical protein A2X87_06805 [Deltaproteobacteria bacterium GWC2_42_51]|nr:MAG: hypothetical protein A2X87_06805 [Deltaproteobacteria bacterium GWC2_42_51]OGP47302.1 MAG: hypothetical protein A2022_10920 [Deltaproteobacteria bacterium GWF2_42_12]OGQ28274.1 MAG: hypothetical protein A3D29_07550 [Deltaproteobacteria bacterium RIFCSPHIGHO2_02_FULL_42_44]OGQ35456.1 MAG: hypothetical protein A3H47_01475 [Deltaproteobacteria bacterium RIFCSPLOWO2_02_FULL_42_39]OGQ58781.1 MAG: hypothetical protein A3G39_04125 [Deltaproteobacteria bacterium RIFCSPLOWO2_12_FULL_43_16]OGQ75